MPTAIKATEAIGRLGAERLARQIKSYWKARGCDVQTRIVPVGSFENAYAVESDMVNGFPKNTEAFRYVKP